MAVPDRNAQILTLLQYLGLYNPIDLSAYSNEDIKDIIKSYEKQAGTPFEEVYDSGLRQAYASDPVMSAAFDTIEMQNKVPEEIINTLTDQQIALNPTQKQHLNDYYDYVQKRNESQAERMFELSQSSGEFGLSPAGMSFDIPGEVASALRVTGGGMNTAQAQQGATAANKALQDYFDRMVAEGLKQNEPAITSRVTGVPPVGRVGGQPTRLDRQGRPIVSGSEEGFQAVDRQGRGRDKTPATPEEERKAKMAMEQKVLKETSKTDAGFTSKNIMAKAWDATLKGQQARDQWVAQAIKNEAEAAYGSPYEMDLQALIAELQRRQSAAAAEAARIKAEKERQKRGF